MNSWAHGGHSASFGLLWAPGWKDFDLTPAFPDEALPLNVLLLSALPCAADKDEGSREEEGGLFTLIRMVEWPESIQPIFH